MADKIANQKQSGGVKKSEILFIYESTYSIPNGDPFTGEQRCDDESKKVLVSDVRIKRFIRDYLALRGNEIYVLLDRTNASTQGKESGAAARMKSLKNKYKDKSAKEILKECIDVRLFGGISTEEGDAVNLTGPIQFALLNPSLNESDLRMHQNTCVFPSQIKNEQGTIGTTTVVPYCVNQIHGWINPFSAQHTNLTEEDIDQMFKALWNSINISNTRTKSNQNSLLLLQIVYSEPTKKIYGVDRLIKLKVNDNKRGEQIRSIDDFELDFSSFIEQMIKSESVSKVYYYSQIETINKEFSGKNKFELMKL
ncbi:MAG: type I-B CRISPR-associated protein Cas7/Csh2 [Proteobacteria bacterium]|nr:type I-B CRISPR-associated protein Cas7/Csh2 [Pseudomonadota bacterium]